MVRPSFPRPVHGEQQQERHAVGLAMAERGSDARRGGPRGRAHGGPPALSRRTILDGLGGVGAHLVGPDLRAEPGVQAEGGAADDQAGPGAQARQQRSQRLDPEGRGEHQRRDQEQVDPVLGGPRADRLRRALPVVAHREAARAQSREHDALAEQVVVVERGDGDAGRRAGGSGLVRLRQQRAHEVLAQPSAHVDLRQGDGASLPALPEVLQGRRDQHLDGLHGRAPGAGEVQHAPGLAVVQRQERALELEQQVGARQGGGLGALARL
ncbi:MAG: hypothetical protein QM765_29440 [Myxococcales bacterium]